jgi:hypothetical protein
VNNARDKLPRLAGWIAENIAAISGSRNTSSNETLSFCPLINHFQICNLELGHDFV